MRRHDALIPLTHDHHHALARARRLRLAAASGNGEEQRAAAKEFVEFFEDDSLLHFREEEEILFPLVIDRSDAPIELLSRLLLEHVRMHRLVGRLRAEIEEGTPSPGDAASDRRAPRRTHPCRGRGALPLDGAAGERGGTPVHPAGPAQADVAAQRLRPGGMDVAGRCAVGQPSSGGGQCETPHSGHSADARFGSSPSRKGPRCCT